MNIYFYAESNSISVLPFEQLWNEPGEPYWKGMFRLERGEGISVLCEIRVYMRSLREMSISSMYIEIKQNSIYFGDNKWWLLWMEMDCLALWLEFKWAAKPVFENQPNIKQSTTFNPWLFDFIYNYAYHSNFHHHHDPRAPLPFYQGSNIS